MKNSEILKNYINSIKSKKLEPAASGNSKYCFLNKKFAILKSKAPITKATSFYERFQNFGKLKAFNNELIEIGVPTGRIYSCAINSGRYYELQERVYGRPLYKYEITSLYNTVTKQKFEKTYLNEIADSEIKDMIAANVFDYNTTTQGILERAPQKHFDALLKAICALENYGINYFDNNSENIVYHPEKGFQIIDLELKDMLVQHNSNPKPEKLVESFRNYVEIFDDSLYFSEHPNSVLDKKQVTIIQNNNIPIAKKLITAARNCNITMRNVKEGIPEIIQMVGKSNFNKKFDEIFKAIPMSKAT